MNDTLILASSSPRRADLLRMIGCRFDILPSCTDEQTEAGLSPGDIVAILALRKAEDIARQHPDRIVIGADTVVVSEGRALGKPANREEAEETLRKLSGTSHQVLTAITLVWVTQNREEHRLAQTDVQFRDLGDDEIARYLDTDEPYDKAGAYGIQGRAALFAESIRGCFYNIVGFPITQFWLALDRITGGDPWTYCTTRPTRDLLSVRD
jgi:septum formation protein